MHGLRTVPTKYKKVFSLNRGLCGNMARPIRIHRENCAFFEVISHAGFFQYILDTIIVATAILASLTVYLWFSQNTVLVVFCHNQKLISCCTSIHNIKFNVGVSTRFENLSEFFPSFLKKIAMPVKYLPCSSSVSQTFTSL